MNMNEKKYFTCFNKDEAKEYIGKMCRFSDQGSRLLSGEGVIGTFVRIKENTECPFMVENHDGEACFRFCTPVEKKLRPYKNLREMVEDAIKHGTDKCGNFYIKKIDSVKTYLVSLLNYCVVKLDTLNNSFETLELGELSKYYTWVDGTPCGVEEEV